MTKATHTDTGLRTRLDAGVAAQENRRAAPQVSAGWGERELPVAGGQLLDMDQDSDAAVIEASMSDPATFGTVFDRHARVLFRYLVRRVGPDEADPLLGELFRVAFERRDSFDRSRPDARPWLYGIATNLLANHRRRELRHMHAMAALLAQRNVTEDAIDSVAAKLDAVALWPRVAEAISTLPEVERSALLLHVWEGLGYEEIAASLEVPVGTVRSRINRARRRLRELRAGARAELAISSDAPGRMSP